MIFLSISFSLVLWDVSSKQYFGSIHIYLIKYLMSKNCRYSSFDYFRSRNFREFRPFSRKLKTQKILFWSIRESLCSRSFSRFSLFLNFFFNFFLTSFFHKNPVSFLRRFALPQVDYLLRELSFAKLDFTRSFILAHSTKWNGKILNKKEEPLIYLMSDLN